MCFQVMVAGNKCDIKDLVMQLFPTQNVVNIVYIDYFCNLLCNDAL